MHAFDILGGPVRWWIFEILADKGDPSSGEIVKIISAEFGISQSAGLGADNHTFERGGD